MLLGYHSGITTVYEGLQIFLRSIGKYLAHAVDPDAEEAIVDDGLEASAPIGTVETSEDAAATSASEASPGSAGEKQLFTDADGLNPQARHGHFMEKERDTPIEAAKPLNDAVSVVRAGEGAKQHMRRWPQS